MVETPIQTNAPGEGALNEDLLEGALRYVVQQDPRGTNERRTYTVTPRDGSAGRAKTYDDEAVVYATFVQVEAGTWRREGRWEWRVFANRTRLTDAQVMQIVEAFVRSEAASASRTAGAQGSAGGAS